MRLQVSVPRTLAAFYLAACPLVAASQLETIPHALARIGKPLMSGPSIPSGPAPEIDRVLEQTDMIVRGIVGTPRSYLSDDETEVLSDYPIRNATVLYLRNTQINDAERRRGLVTVTLLGGKIEINNLTFTSGHAALPRLEPGSEVVLCIEQSGSKKMIALRYFGAFDVRERRLVPLTQKQGFAPDLQDVPVAQAAAALVARARAIHGGRAPGAAR